MRKIRLANGQYALVDDENYRELRKYKWRIRGQYACRELSVPRGETRKALAMHHAVMGLPPKGLEMDHADRNKLNNQKSNLRFCTHAQNMHNCKHPKGKSRYRGLYWHKQGKCWVARIRHKGQFVALGCYVIEKNAARAYDEAAKKYYGVFAWCNFTK